MLGPACDEPHHRPSHHASPSKWDSPVPGQCSQAQRRLHEYLTPKEVERLIATARQNRYGHRDATMMLIAYRRGLRVSELCALRWDQVDFG